MNFKKLSCDSVSTQSPADAQRGFFV